MSLPSGQGFNVGPMTSQAAEKEISTRIKDQMSQLPIDVLKKIIDQKNIQDQTSQEDVANQVLQFFASSGGNMPTGSGPGNPNPTPPPSGGGVSNESKASINTNASLDGTDNSNQQTTTIPGSTTDKAKNGNLLEGLASGLMMGGGAGMGLDPSAMLKNLLGAKIQQQEIAGTVPWQKGDMEKALTTAGFDNAKLTNEGIQAIGKAHDEVFKTLTLPEKIGMAAGIVPERIKALSTSLQTASSSVSKAMGSRGKLAGELKNKVGNAIKVTSVKEIKK